MNCLGYGTSQGTPYWLLQNSWGTDNWGEEGYGKVKRGVNLANIEEWAMAPRAWVTDGREPPCQDSSSGSGLRAGERVLSCTDAVNYCSSHYTVAALCPRTC